MLISIPTCADDQINLMVHQASIDLKYYCAKLEVSLGLGRNIPHTFTVYVKYFSGVRTIMNLELTSFICRGIQAIPVLFSDKYKAYMSIDESNKKFPFLFCLIVTVVPPGLKRCTESKPR